MSASTPPTPDPSTDDLASFALDAVDADEARAIDVALAGNEDAARIERRLRAAAGELGAAGAGERAPAPALRGRVLAAAGRRRAPVTRREASPAEIHRTELVRAVLLLRRLVDRAWEATVDPPELAGWTVHDLAVHLAANETLLASAIGAGLPGVPEIETDNELRTAHARARHRHLPPLAAVEELEAAAEAVDRVVATMADDRLDDTVEFWRRELSIRRVLFIRAFETWTHADDIRRAVGLSELAPPEPTLRAMGHTAAGLVPDMLHVRGIGAPGRRARLHLTGGGGGTWDVDLDGGPPRPPSAAVPDVELSVDVVDFCRAVSARRPVEGLVTVATGDSELIDRIVTSIPALAVV